MPPLPVQVADAVRHVPLQLDLRSATEEELQLVLPLATTLPLNTLLLSPHHASGEALLRCNAVAARSGGSLHRLGATVACTDTLQRFAQLRELHLHAGVLERLYPGGEPDPLLLASTMPCASPPAS